MLKEIVSSLKYFNHYKFNSVFFKYFRVIFIITLLSFSIIVLMVSQYYISSYQKELEQDNQRATERGMEFFDNLLFEMSSASNYLVSDAVIQNFLSTSAAPTSPLDSLKLISDSKRLLGAFTLSSDYISSIYLYSQNNNHVLYSGLLELDKFHDKNLIMEYMNSGYKTNSIVSRKVDLIGTGSTIDVITYIKPVKDIGLVIVNIDAYKLSESMDKKMGKLQNSLIFADAKQNIIYATNNKLFTKQLSDVADGKVLSSIEKNNSKAINIDGVPTIIDSKTIENNMTVVSLLQDTNYQSNRMVRWFVVLIAILFSLFMSVAIALIVSAKLFKPIETVLAAIENPEQWLSDSESNKQGFDELKYISQNILSSFETHQQMEQKLAQRLMLLKNAQSLALYSQITPHFLFNTLQTINLMALEIFKSDNKLSNTITLLADMLRISLKEENLVPLSTEVTHATLYEKIQKERYMELFHIEWDIEEGLSDYLVPKVILQPILENSIYHGIKNRSRNGQIQVKIRRWGDSLLFTVDDDGVGLSEKEINELNQKLLSDYTNPIDHIGLQNVNQRVKITYGEEYGVILSNSHMGGLRVSVRIPHLKQA